MPGPLPNPNRRRRNAAPPVTMLPAGGRTGPPPDFPIGKPTKPVADLWARLWATPQAVVWEQQGYATIRVVARYVRKVLAAEAADAPSALQAEVRQLEDRLLISPIFLKRAGFAITTDEVGERRAELQVAATPDRPTVRAFDPKLVSGGAAGS